MSGDLGEPTMAGVYDGLLGGIANYDPDRRLVERIAALSAALSAGPGRLARENRAFLRRAVGFCVADGVRQFLDVGCGAPRDDSPFALVGGLGCRVVCVDVDPEVVAHTTLAAAGVGVFEADCRRPDRVLAQAARSGLDFGLPVAVLLVSVLEFVRDADDPAGVVAGYRAGLAPGSLLVLSHPSADTEPALHGIAARCPGAPTLRSRREVAALLPAGTLVEPGLVPVPRWVPDGPEPVEAGGRYPYYAAVVRC